MSGWREVTNALSPAPHGPLEEAPAHVQAADLLDGHLHEKEENPT